MTRRVLLNNVDHADLKVAARHGAAFGDAVNQVLVFPTEFEPLQREYPIFFRRDGEDALQAVALLGLDRDENLFLTGESWNARYVPAVQQRGPFSILAPRDGGEPMIHVDLDDPRVGDAGEPLFLPAGGAAPYLQQMSRTLGLIYEGLGLAREMFAAFEQLGLIEPVAVEIEVGDGRRYTLPGLFTVSQERLAELDGEALVALNRSGLLRLAVLALASLDNVSRLIELKAAKGLG